VFSFIPEHTFGLAPQLPDTLARDAEFLAKVGERRRLLTVQAVTADEEATLALREPFDGLQKAAPLELPHHFAGYPGLAFVLNKVTEFRAILL
jgi:hypothetical protein